MSLAGPLAGRTALVADGGCAIAVAARDALIAAGASLFPASGTTSDAPVCPDVLVVFAVPDRAVTIEALSDDQLDMMVEVGLRRPWRLCRAMVRAIDPDEAGRSRAIVLVTTQAATRGLAGHSGDSAIAAGLVGLTRALARELGPRRITVNCVALGAIGDIAEQDRLLVPLGRGGTVQEAAQAILSLCLPDAGYITGVTLDVAGGR